MQNSLQQLLCVANVWLRLFSKFFALRCLFCRFQKLSWCATFLTLANKLISTLVQTLFYDYRCFAADCKHASVQFCAIAKAFHNFT